MTLEDEFGDIILKARAGLGFTVGFVSEETGVDRTGITQLEALAKRPTPEQVEVFAKLLHLNTNKLMDIAFYRYSPAPVPPRFYQNVRTILGHIGSYEVKGYLVTDPSTCHSVMIDTAYNPEKMIETLIDERLTLTGILLTHTHHDHMGGVDQILKRFNVPVYVSREEAGQLKAFWDPGRDRLIKEGETISVGKLSLEVFQTPGHTPGGTGYVCRRAGESFGFFGDAIFAGSLGRAYSNASYPELIQSVKNKVLTLPGETVLFPGHGPATTVNEEREHNPFF